VCRCVSVCEPFFSQLVVRACSKFPFAIIQSALGWEGRHTSVELLCCMNFLNYWLSL